jgi:hypothetical protein
MRPLHLPSLALALALTPQMLGCGSGASDLLNASPYLTWSKPLPAGAPSGRVVVLPPSNDRPPDKGGNAPRSVGNVRAEAGIPYAVNAERDDEIPGAIGRLVSDALATTGVTVTGPGDGAATALAQTRISELWCDGWQAGMFIKVYKSNMTLNVAVLDPVTREKRTEITVHGSGGGDSCGPAVQKSLETALAELTTALAAPAVHAALTSPATGAGPAPADPIRAPSVTRSDGDGCVSTKCKHGRVCSQGRCVAPGG